MKIYDISQEVFGCNVYPGDPSPKKIPQLRISNGDVCNLTAFEMCAHNGTHVDAPLHFWDEGSPVDDIRLNTFYGKCTVVTVEGILTGDDLDRMLPYCRRRLLIRGHGNTFLSHSAAIVLAESKVVLVGTDADSIAPPFDEARPHRELARAGIVVLENLYLEDIHDGEYDLCAFPVRLGGLEAAPCRAILLEMEKGLH